MYLRDFPVLHYLSQVFLCTLGLISRRLGARPNTPIDERPLERLRLTCQLGRQRGRVVSASDLQSDGPGFKSSSGHGFVFGRPEFKSSAMLVNSQLVASCQLGF